MWHFRYLLFKADRRVYISNCSVLNAFKTISTWEGSRFLTQCDMLCSSHTLLLSCNLLFMELPYNHFKMSRQRQTPTWKRVQLCSAVLHFKVMGFFSVYQRAGLYLSL